MKYVYPAIFKKEKASDGRISYGVSFPDIQGSLPCRRRKLRRWDEGF